MKNWDYIFSFGGWIGLVICLVFIVLFDRCQEHQASVHTIEKNTVVIYDSTKKEIIPASIPVGISIQTVGIPANIDTNKILQAYFAIHTYSDQIQDTALRIQIFDSVAQNKIFGRRINYSWLLPVKTVESTTVNTVADPSGLYAGGFATGTKQQFGIGPKITWLTKSKVMVSYGYDVLNNSHQLGTQFFIYGRAKR